MEVAELRKITGLSQENFAKLVGAGHKTTISQWERGKRIPDRYFQAKLKELEKKLTKN